MTEVERGRGTEWVEQPDPRQLPPRHSRPDRRRRSILPVVALVAGCLAVAIIAALSLRPNGSGDVAPPPASTSSATPSAPAAVTGPSALSSNDSREIYRQLEWTRSAAFDQYRPELLDSIYSADCGTGCLIDQEKKVIQQLSGERSRYNGFAPEVLLVEVVAENKAVLEGTETRSVTIRVVSRQAPFVVVDESGKVLENGEGWSPQSAVYDLHYSRAKGRWVIWHQGLEGPGEPYLKPSPSP